MEILEVGEMFSSQLFECEFKIGNEEISKMLKNQLISIDKHNLKFQLVISNKEISPLVPLIEIFNDRKAFDIDIKFHSKNGDIVGILTYHRVLIESVDFLENSFNYQKSVGIDFSDDYLDLRISVGSTSYDQIKISNNLS